MNQITFEDFGLFRDELLQVDFISFNLSKLSESQILQLANYFKSLGFNCYQRKEETSQSRQEVYANYKYYSSNDIRKELHINRFIDNYPSSLNNKQKKQIKQYFIYYLQTLNQQQKIQNKVLDLSSNDILDIYDLNTSHLNIAVFESINIKFT